MRYMLLDTKDQKALLRDLESMPGFLKASFASLTALDAAAPGPGDTFSPVEHCWHLADLEREGYAVRIRRLSVERDPVLPDFDGARIAQERDYRSLPLAEAMVAFADARRTNVAALRALGSDEWLRRGTQDGVGSIATCDIPRMMAEHDASHRQEIEAWIQARRRQ